MGKEWLLRFLRKLYLLGRLFAQCFVTEHEPSITHILCDGVKSKAILLKPRLGGKATKISQTGISSNVQKRGFGIVVKAGNWESVNSSPP